MTLSYNKFESADVRCLSQVWPKLEKTRKRVFGSCTRHVSLTAPTHCDIANIMGHAIRA